MAKKFTELEGDEKRSIEEQLEGISSSMGMEAWESYGTDVQTGLKELIGMCHNCKCLMYCKTEFGNVNAVCTEFKIRLSGQNRITECNLHTPKGVMSLNEMYSMAYLIDKNTDKKIKGFTTQEPKKKKKKKSNPLPKWKAEFPELKIK